MTADQADVPLDPTPLEHEAYGWVVRFISGEAGSAELEALRQWSARSPAHAEAFDRASQVWKALDPARRKLLAETHPVAALPIGRSRSVPSRPAGLGRRAFLGGAIAASAAGATFLAVRPPLELWPSWSELAADYRTGTGERRGISLADSVSVDMNTQTSIALRSSGETENRIELITGEAMISIARPSGSLTVLAGDGHVVASLARFNVRESGRSVCVTCLEGDVRIENAATSLRLPAGRQAVYSGREINGPLAVDPAVVTAWKDGIIIFDATPVAEVVAEVNRYRRGKVILTNAALGREKFNARFRLENIDRVIGQIELVFGAKARSLPGGITLLS